MIHPQLEKDCLLLGRFELSYVLLMKDANYPWLILVPAVEGISEIYQLSESQQQLLLTESSYVAEKMMAHFQGQKMNIAALGNIVPQLHLHHVVRYEDDPAWPAPVWGKLPANPYTDAQLSERVDALKNLFTDRLRLV